MENNEYKEDPEYMEALVNEAIQEQKEGKTQRLDFSRPIHEQIIEGL